MFLKSFHINKKQPNHNKNKTKPFHKSNFNPLYISSAELVGVLPRQRSELELRKAGRAAKPCRKL